MKPFLLAVILALTVTATFGHSGFDTTTPQNGAVLVKAPPHIVLTFTKGIHIHGHHFHEVHTDGSLGHYRDTTLVDRARSRQILCVFDNPGKWLLHCHTLAHQASGMKTWVEVL